MAKENEVISATGYFDGQSSKGNFDVQLKFKFPERALSDSIQFIAGIGKRLILLAIVNEEKIPLGTFNIYNMRIDKDANNMITFKSNLDYVRPENFAKLITEETEILLKAKILKEE